MSQQQPVSQLPPEEIFRLLDTTNSHDVVNEIKQFINEQLAEVKDAWLVNGLFETYGSTRSARCLELLLGVRDPHDKFLLDKLSECLKAAAAAGGSGGRSRARACLGLDVLGYVVRKQPSWLYRITSHPLLKDLMRVLRTEDDLVMLMTGLLDLIALLPTVPANIGNHLGEIFEVFGRIAHWRTLQIKSLPEMQKVHVQVALFSFFHRLYGMFPCNFLSFLRTQYSDAATASENHLVFVQTIRPMLDTVRMHPMLVTHSRDQEKTSNRWRKMELHDVIVESSKYSLVREESAKEDSCNSGASDVVTVNQDKQLSSHPHAHSGASVRSDLSSTIRGMLKQDPLWTPGKVCGLSTPPHLHHHHHHHHAVTAASAVVVQAAAAATSHHPKSPAAAATTAAGGIVASRLTLDSPPEAAIEATPETTPYVTPVKEDTVRASTLQQANRNLRLDMANAALKSPASVLDKNSCTGSSGSHSSGAAAVAGNNGQPLPPPPFSPGAKSISSPLSQKDVSPFRFPDLPMHPATAAGGGRRESAAATAAAAAAVDLRRRDSLFESSSRQLLSSARLSIDRGGNGGTLHEAAAGGGSMIPPSVPPLSSSFSSVAVSSSALLASAAGGEELAAAAASDGGCVKFSLTKPFHSVDQIAAESSSSGGGGQTSTATAASAVASAMSRIQIAGGNVDKHRPSPVKFTSQRPEQFPIKPTPERRPTTTTTTADVGGESAAAATGSNSVVKHKMLSLETLKDALPDFGKEEDDDEVTKLTGGSDVDPRSSHQMTTRHITPLVCSGSSSATNSRTTSRLSSSSQAEKVSRPTTVMMPAPPAAAAAAAPPSGGGASAAAATPAAAVAPQASSEPSIGVKADGEEKLAAPPATSAKDDEEEQQTKPETEVEKTKTAAGEKDIGEIRRHVSVQTSELTTASFPYEHLFPCVLPQWIKPVEVTSSENEKQTESKSRETAATNDDDDDDDDEQIFNPYDALDQFIKASGERLMEGKKSAAAADGDAAGEGSESAAAVSKSEVKVLQDEISLLYNQVLFERQRREVLGLRNRRLLAKTKFSRVLEEQNTALQAQLQIRKAEIDTLFDQLETVRREKHEVEEDRAANAKQRDEEIERLVKENNGLKREKVELEGKLDGQGKELVECRGEKERGEAACFDAISQVEMLRKKDSSRVKAEAELVELRKELLLVGEVARKYREQRPNAAGDDVVKNRGQKMLLDTLEHQLAQVESRLSARSNEVEVSKAKIKSLEDQLISKDQLISDQKQLMERIREEGDDRQKDLEASYQDVVKINFQLESKMLEVLSHTNGDAAAAPIPSTCKECSRRRGSTASSTRSSTIRASAGGGGRSNAVSPTSPTTGYGEVFAVSTASGGGGGGSSSSSVPPSETRNSCRAATHSANMDIAARPTPAVVAERSSFRVGSPPSSGGSQDQSEVIRRMLDSGCAPISAERAMSGASASSAGSNSAAAAAASFAPGTSVSTSRMMMMSRAGPSGNFSRRIDDSAPSPPPPQTEMGRDGQNSAASFNGSK